MNEDEDDWNVDEKQEDVQENKQYDKEWCILRGYRSTFPVMTQQMTSPKQCGSHSPPVRIEDDRGICLKTVYGCMS